MENTKDLSFTHIDDWLNKDPFYLIKEEAYARFILSYKRKSVSAQMSLQKYMGCFRLFADYQGKQYRVTGASRLGDVYLADFNRNSGYDYRVPVDSLSNWTSCPNDESQATVTELVVSAANKIQELATQDKVSPEQALSEVYSLAELIKQHIVCAEASK